MNKRVVVLKPNDLAGTVAELNGNRFRYPGQNFWVQPVLIRGKNTLITEYREIEDMDQSLDAAVDEFLDITKRYVLNMDPTIVYDYQNLLMDAYCPSCNSKLDWRIAVQASGVDDKFCQSECCGMVYSMVPEKVRVVAIPAAVLRGKEADNADDDFINELRKI